LKIIFSFFLVLAKFNLQDCVEFTCFDHFVFLLTHFSIILCDLFERTNAPSGRNWDKAIYQSWCVWCAFSIQLLPRDGSLLF